MPIQQFHNLEFERLRKLRLSFVLSFGTVINDFPLRTRRMECELTTMYERISFCLTNLARISFFQRKNFLNDASDHFVMLCVNKYIIK